MVRLRLRFAACAAHLARTLIRLLKLGHGTSFGGHLARGIYPDIFSQLCRQIPGKVIFITGTNGKTTTTRLLAGMFGEGSVISNTSGANLETGLIAALIQKSSLFGTLKRSDIVLEVDEKELPHILRNHAPHLLICLNLFRDQLDRYGEMDAIKQTWQDAMLHLPESTRLLFNGDDPLLCQLGSALPGKVQFFGLQEEELALARLPHTADSIHCPDCRTALAYRNIYLSHLGDFHCRTCSFRREKPMEASNLWPSISPHIHNRYNTMAAVSAALLLGKKEAEILYGIEAFSPAFGRGEILDIEGRHVLMLLSKNAVSLNASLAMAKEKKGPLLLALNDREADGKDVSWIWDADFEGLIGTPIYVTGRRGHEMALRLSYEDIPSLVFDTPSEALGMALSNLACGDTLHILANYTAMLHLRSLLLSKKQDRLRRQDKKR